MMDERGRLWFGENRSDIDRDVRHEDRRHSRSGRRRRRARGRTTSPSTRTATCGRAANTTTASCASIRRPGQFIEYLLPRQTNVRRVFVDNSTTPGDLLGGQQPRRVDREAGAARRRGQTIAPDRRRFLRRRAGVARVGGGFRRRRLAARSTLRAGADATRRASRSASTSIITSRRRHGSTEVKGRPLLQPANTTWTPEKSIEDMDRGGVAAAVVSITNPGLWFGDAAVTTTAGARVQRVRREAGAGSSDAVRPVRGDAAARRRRAR